MPAIVMPALMITAMRTGAIDRVEGFCIGSFRLSEMENPEVRAGADAGVRRGGLFVEISALILGWKGFLTSRRHALVKS